MLAGFRSIFISRFAVIALILFGGSFSIFSRTASAEPQTLPITKEEKPAIDTTGKFKIGGILGQGIGSENHMMGRGFGGKKIWVNGGSGSFYLLSAGYGFTSEFEGEIALGRRQTNLRSLESADRGTFIRTPLAVTVRRIIPRTDDSRWKIGFGVEHYSNNELNMDTTSIGGDRVWIKYKDALGWHIEGIFEKFLEGGHSAFSAGLTYKNLTYIADRWNKNGSSMPVDSLKDEWAHLKCNGIDLTIAYTYYF